MKTLRNREDVMSESHPPASIAEARRTSLGLYVTAKEAYDMWQADPEGVRILDVRTPEEWVFTGHAPMAWNIPFALLAYEWDTERNAFPWELNPGFVSAVKEWTVPDDTILVSCRSGGRSAMAINTLAAAGFTNVYNILDGMEGSKVDDPESVFHGMRMKNGWKNSGLPWTYDLDPARIQLPARESGTLQQGNEHD
jgi:rhodanese-related sulfurtransferase